MDLSDFRRHLSARGPDLATWPDRDAAIDLLAVSDEAVALLAAAGADAPIDADLTESVLSATKASD